MIFSLYTEKENQVLLPLSQKGELYVASHLYVCACCVWPPSRSPRRRLRPCSAPAADCLIMGAASLLPCPPLRAPDRRQVCLLGGAPGRSFLLPNRLLPTSRTCQASCFRALSRVAPAAQKLPSASVVGCTTQCLLSRFICLQCLPSVLPFGLAHFVGYDAFCQPSQCLASS